MRQPSYVHLNVILSHLPDANSNTPSIIILPNKWTEHHQIDGK